MASRGETTATWGPCRPPAAARMLRPVSNRAGGSELRGQVRVVSQLTGVLAHRLLDCPVFQRLVVARLAGVVLGIADPQPTLVIWLQSSCSSEGFPNGSERG